MRPMNAGERAGPGELERLVQLASYEAAAAARRRGSGAAQGRRISNTVVLVLMVATSAVSLFDLYLLGTGVPH